MPRGGFSTAAAARSVAGGEGLPAQGASQGPAASASSRGGAAASPEEAKAVPAAASPRFTRGALLGMRALALTFALGVFQAWRQHWPVLPETSEAAALTGEDADAGRTATLPLEAAPQTRAIATTKAVAAPLGDLPPDPAEAQNLFEQAALAGHWGAAYALAMIELDSGNRSRAAPWLEMVAAEGDERAHALARHFQHRWGLGQHRDPELAGAYLQAAAELGEPNAALLLAEAHAHEGTKPEVEPLGGRKLSVAIQYYRQAASLGRSTCRYNLGALLVRLAGGRPEDASPEVCREIRAEFAEVATDLDPTFRLLFALGLRAWELGDGESALGLFMLLSEAGSAKAHRNAARLWEALLPRAAAEAGGAPSAGHCIREAGEQQGGDAAARTSLQGAYPGGFRVTRVHAGHFCCSGGTCDSEGSCECTWLFNEGGVDFIQCVNLCIKAPQCGFATMYANGYCQLSSDCNASFAAGDESAETYAVQRDLAAPIVAPPLQPLAEVPEVAVPAGAAAHCWPPNGALQSARSARLCAALFHARAGAAGGEASAPAGSALAAGAGAAEAAALAAAAHFERLGAPGPAQAWACWAAQRFTSKHGRLFCARLEAELWEGHSRNLSLAMQGLTAFAETGELDARIAAGGAIAWLLLKLVWDAAVDCRVEVRAGGVLCPSFRAIAASWGASETHAAMWQLVLEWLFTGLAITTAGAFFAVIAAGLRGLVRAFIPRS